MSPDRIRRRTVGRHLAWACTVCDEERILPVAQLGALAVWALDHEHSELDADPPHADVTIGSQIRFTPGGGASGSRWWTVVDRDDRFVVATAPEPFRPDGALLYTVVDLTGWRTRQRNGAGHGVVRSSLNTLGGGWDTDPEGLARIIPALRAGEWTLSRRRLLDVDRIERRQSVTTSGGACG